MKKTNKWCDCIKMNVEVICFVLLLIVSIGLNVHFAQTKEGMFCDEIYSYGLSNSVWYPFLDVGSSVEMSEGNSGWVKANYFIDYLVVHDWERTSYRQVWTNQASDTLPPLYYAAIHFVCSLFPDRFSKWEGLAVNFVCLGVALFYLWHLAAKYVEKKYALAACVAWAFSAACINTVTYIRMYAMITCAVLALVNLFSDIIMQQHNITLCQWLKLIIILIVGTLIHYYFVIFVAAVAVQYFIYLLLTKRFKLIVAYVAAFFVAAGGTIAVFPAIIQQITKGHRGPESFDNFFHKTDGFAGHFNNLNNTFFGGFLPVVILILIILVVRMLIESIKHKEVTAKQLGARMICVAALLYILIVAKIAPYSGPEGNRYLYMIYPVIAFLMVYICCQTPRKVRFAVLFGMCLWIGLSTARSENILFQYKDTDLRMDIIAKDEGEDCIYIYDSEYWFDTYQMCLNFIHYDEVRFVEKNELSDLERILKMRTTESKGLVIAFCPVFTNDDINNLWNDIKTITGFNHLVYRYNDSANVYYACTKEDEYCYEDGALIVSQEKCLDGEWYYFDENGRMVKDKDVYLNSNGGKWVRYDENGRMVKGEDYNYNGWYYFDQNTGAMAKGAVTLDDGRKVYYDPMSGQMQRGKCIIDGKAYHFDVEDGHLLGWQSDKLWKE